MGNYRESFRRCSFCFFILMVSVAASVQTSIAKAVYLVHLPALKCTGGDSDLLQYPGFPKNDNWKVKSEALYKIF